MRASDFDVPILLITFNRPDNAQKVFDKIKKAQPSKFFIFSDAPRKGNATDELKVGECRNLLSQIDWECQVHTKFERENLGCGRGVSSAISWAFDYVDKLIILEDDCVPHASFFSYCQYMLTKYEKDEKVMHIAGTRWNDEYNIGEVDHFFSRIAHIWGWATWKRAWKLYDYKMLSLHKHDRVLLKKKLNDRIQSQYWLDCFFHVHKHNGTELINTWDYQWQYTIFKNNGLAVVPNVNLISNIGVQGVHTHNGKGDKVSYNKHTANWTTRSSQPVKLNAVTAFDNYHIKHHFMRNLKPLKKFQLYLKSFL
jgi:hypothetical protein